MISPKPWDLDSILFFGALLMASILCGVGAAQLLPKIWPTLAGRDAQVFRFVISTIFAHGVALVLGHFFLRAHDVKWRNVLLGERKRLSHVVAIGIGAGVLVVPIARLLIW